MLWAVEGFLNDKIRTTPATLATIPPRQTMLFTNYNSSRVGVGCCMSPLFFTFYDRITFERLELEGWNFVWGLIMEISSKKEPMEKFHTPTNLPPSETVAMG